MARPTTGSSSSITRPPTGGGGHGSISSKGQALLSGTGQFPGHHLILYNSMEVMITEEFILDFHCSYHQGIVYLMQGNGSDSDIPSYRIVQEYNFQTSIGFSVVIILLFCYMIFLFKNNPSPGSDILINIFLSGIISIILIGVVIVPFQVSRGPLSFEIHPDSFQLKRKSNRIIHIPFASDVCIDVVVTKKTWEESSRQVDGYVIKNSDMLIKINPYRGWTSSQIDELREPIQLVIDRTDVTASKRMKEFVQQNL